MPFIKVTNTVLYYCHRGAQVGELMSWIRDFNPNLSHASRDASCLGNSILRGEVVQLSDEEAQVYCAQMEAQTLQFDRTGQRKIPFVRGTQVVYLPDHAGRDANHPDVEFGFVTSGPTEAGEYFCRFWRRGHPGDLRTRTNSERVAGDHLMAWGSVSQSVVDQALEVFC